MRRWMVAAGIFGFVFGLTYGWFVHRLADVSASMRPLTAREAVSYAEEQAALAALP